MGNYTTTVSGVLLLNDRIQKTVIIGNSKMKQGAPTGLANRSNSISNHKLVLFADNSSIILKVKRGL